MARINTGGMRKQRPSALAGRYTATSNPSPTGIWQGTPGGETRGPAVAPSGKRPGLRFRIGDEGYIWILVAMEIILMAWLRSWSRAHHGG